MPETTEANHPHDSPLADTHAPQRGVGGDTRAQQRRHALRVEPVGKPAGEVLVEGILRGVTALGDTSCPVGAAVRLRRPLYAPVLPSRQAGRAAPARADDVAACSARPSIR